MNQEEARTFLELSKSDSLLEILNLGAGLLHHPVFVKDMTGSTVAYDNVSDVTDEEWDRVVVQDQITSGWKKVLKCHSEKETVVEFQDGLFHIPYYVYYMKRGREFFGVVVMSAHHTAFTAWDKELFEFICGFIQKHFEKTKKMINGKTDALEHLFEEILKGSYGDEHDLLKRFEYLGWKKKKYTHLMVLEKTVKKPMDEKQCIEEWNQMHHGVAFYYHQYILYLMSNEEPFEQIKNREQIEVLLNKWKLKAGLSPEIDNMLRLPEIYDLTQRALYIGQKLQMEEQIYFYEQLSVYDMIHRMSQVIDVRVFCHRKIIALHEYDKKHHTEFMKTLQIYLESTKEISRVAERMGLHRNTVRYRLDKCEELLEDNFRNGDVTFHYVLSLKIMRYLENFMENREE